MNDWLDDPADGWLREPKEVVPEGKPATSETPNLPVPIGPEATTLAVTALEKRAQFVMAWESLTEKQRVFLNTWRESRFNANRAMRILDKTPLSVSKTSITNWSAEPAFELVRTTLREASIEEILSRANLVARQDDIVETAMTPKPILHQGQHTGFEEVEVGIAARANETLLRVGGHLKDKDLEVNVGIIGPSFAIQVVQQDGKIIDVTPQRVPIELPEPAEEADWTEA